MDGHQFDRLTQGFSQALTRRRFGTLLATLGLAAGFGAAPEALAKKKKKKKKPKTCQTGAVKCGAACVDTRTNAQHCGGCSQPCGAGQSCVAGACQGGGGGGYPCNNVYDCGGAFRGAVCRNGQCACEDPTMGLCNDPSWGSYANCNPCCPGGNGICLRPYTHTVSVDVMVR